MVRAAKAVGLVAEAISVDRLLSKIVAGGLSAGVILLWWPLVFPSDTVESWLVRGVLWTLCFELMLHAFGPVEQGLWRSRAARRIAEPAGRAAGTRFRLVVAAAALAVPLALLATAPAHDLSPAKPAAASVRHVTEVKRVVRVERREVLVPRGGSVAVGRPRTGGATPQAAGSTVGLAPRPTGAAAVRRPAARVAAPRRSPTERPDRSSGSSGSASTPNQPAATSPGTTMGSDERAATSTVAQPKPRPLASAL